MMECQDIQLEVEGQTDMLTDSPLNTINNINDKQSRKPKSRKEENYPSKLPYKVVN